MHECTYEKYVHVYITCSLRNCIVYTHKIQLIFDNFWWYRHKKSCNDKSFVMKNGICNIRYTFDMSITSQQMNLFK